MYFSKYLFERLEEVFENEVNGFWNESWEYVLMYKIEKLEIYRILKEGLNGG